MTPGQLFPLFTAIWGIVGIASFILYRWAGSDTKRRWHPVVVIGTALLFVSFVGLVMPAWVTVTMALSVALIAYLKLVYTRFCPRCAAVVVDDFRSPSKSCRRCGGTLDKSAPHA